MRQYSLVFMEQRLGAKRLSPLGGAQGVASFAARDDEAALAHISEHFVERLKSCARAELSSLLIVQDAGGTAAPRLVDDTHANPQFQDTYVKYDPVAKVVEFDWESTRTVMIANLPTGVVRPISGSG